MSDSCNGTKKWINQKAAGCCLNRSTVRPCREQRPEDCDMSVASFSSNGSTVIVTIAWKGNRIIFVWHFHLVINIVSALKRSNRENIPPLGLFQMFSMALGNSLQFISKGHEFFQATSPQWPWLLQNQATQRPIVTMTVVPQQVRTVVALTTLKLVMWVPKKVAGFAPFLWLLVFDLFDIWKYRGMGSKPE
jgi:hypothetical protein